MLHKVTEYLILSLASFCLFSALFRSVAYAQTPQNELPLSNAPHEKLLANQPPASPTPTMYLAQTQTATQTTSPAPTTTQTPNQTTPTPAVTTTTITPTQTAVASKEKTVSTPTPVKQVLTPTPVKPTVAPVASGSIADVLFSMVNNYRQAKGLPAFIKDDQVCSLANARATEIAAEMAAGTLHSGMYARNLPYWNTENAAAYGSAEANFNWWLSDGIHRQAIESSKTHSCTACSGIYCVQEFTSFQPK